MIKKYFKYILLTFTVTFLFQLDTFAKADTVELKKSSTSYKSCYYQYNDLSLTVYQVSENEIKVSSSDGVRFTSPTNKDSDFFKNGNFSCVPLKVYDVINYIDAFIPEEFIGIRTDEVDQSKILTATWDLKATVNGKLTEYTSSCVYKISEGTFTVKFNPATKKTEYKLYNDIGQELLDNRISSSAKKGWKYNASGLVCRDDIVLDYCPPEDVMLAEVDSIHVRTTANRMDTTCIKSTDPGGIKVTEKDTEASGSKLLFLSDICEEDAGTMKVVRFIGYLLVIVKILIPIGLIIIGVINFFKAMLSGNDDSIKKNAYSFAWKIVFAIVIFVLPTVINFIVGLIDGATDGTEDYENCRNCIFDPKNCDIPNE